MSRKRKRRRRPAPESRREILDAAEHRLLVGGPEAIRLQDIAADVGVSHPAILHHFGTREALVRALVARVVEHFRAALLGGPGLRPGAGMRPAVERLARAIGRGGQARLLAWVVLSRRPLHGLGPGSLRALADALRGPRRRNGVRDDARFVPALVLLVLLGDALVGREVRRSLGLPGDAATARRFQAWVGTFLAERGRA